MAAGTRIPAASVEGLTNGSANSRPASNAAAIGAQPSAWTLIMRGRSRPSQPSASISSNAFQIPTIPVPPPVG